MSRTVVCLNCRLHWTISRNKVKRHAREENRLDALRKASEAERSRIAVSGRYYGGARHG